MKSGCVYTSRAQVLKSITDDKKNYTIYIAEGTHIIQSTRIYMYVNAC